MHHACMVTCPITRLVTWYGDITPYERSHWLFVGHVVCQPNLILDPICIAANIIHPHFPALRKVAHDQNLALPLTSLRQKKFDQKFSKSQFCKDLENSILCKKKNILSLDFRKILSKINNQHYLSSHRQYPSSHRQYPSSNQQYPSSNQQYPAATSNHHASSIPAATRNHLASSIPAATSSIPAATSSIPAATSNHPASSIPAATSNHPASSIPAATSIQPASTSINTAAVPQNVAPIQQQSQKK